MNNEIAGTARLLILLLIAAVLVACASRSELSDIEEEVARLEQERDLLRGARESLLEDLERLETQIDILLDERDAARSELSGRREEDVAEADRLRTELEEANERLRTMEQRIEALSRTDSVQDEKETAPGILPEELAGTTPGQRTPTERDRVRPEPATPQRLPDPVSDRHEPRDPPAYRSVDSVIGPRPAQSTTEFSDSGTLLIDPPEGSRGARLYDDRRNPWNGDRAYGFVEFDTTVGAGEPRLYLSVDVVRPRTQSPFDVRAIELRSDGSIHRFGIPDELVHRTENTRRRRDQIYVPLDAQTYTIIERVMAGANATFNVEGSFEMTQVRIASAERRGIRRIIDAYRSAGGSVHFDGVHTPDNH